VHAALQRCLINGHGNLIPAGVGSPCSAGWAQWATHQTLVAAVEAVIGCLDGETTRPRRRAHRPGHHRHTARRAGTGQCGAAQPSTGQSTRPHAGEGQPVGTCRHQSQRPCYRGCMTTDPAGRYWDDVYDRVGADRVSWFQTDAAVSVSMIASAGPVRSIVDVGGGASVLVDELLTARIPDITVLDLSSHALRRAQRRLGHRAAAVQWLNQDVRSWAPGRRFDLWHDRAVFHFLTDLDDRDAYRTTLRQAVNPGGHVVIGTFAAHGPTHCSGLSVARYDPAALAAEFPNLHLVDTRRVEHITPGGVTQPFTWVLLAANPDPQPGI
jgi:hypothetical protein